MSLVLQHGAHCKPPVSRMGNKFGYSRAILRVMGLRPGQGAREMLLCEPDPGCRALLHAYTDPALMREAAEIIRGWKDEDPRELWERLRAEGPIRDFGAREVGRKVLVEGWGGLASVAFNGPGCHPSHDGSRTADTMAERCDSLAQASELARYLQVTASNRLVNIDSTTMQNSGQGGTTFGGDEFATGAGKVADAAREVARFGAIAGGTFGCNAPRYNAGRGRWEYTGGITADGSCKGRPVGISWKGPEAQSMRGLAASMRPLGLPATIVPDAREIYPPTLPPGCVAYMDGPYEDTTGYGHAFPRAEQVEVIRRWDEAGAACYVSEAEPIPELVADGWHAVEITSTRVGQKRTFSKQKREWLTCNREPAWVPAVQQGLFG